MPNGTSTNDPKTKADAFADRFDSVFSAQKKLSSFDRQPLDADFHCDFAFVEKQLASLSTNKSCGPDRFPAIFPLPLINRSLNEGVVPDEWRSAEIVPVPKKPAASTVAYRRPIVKLSIIPKIFERHINQLIWKFLSPVISNIQYGFRSGRSTVDCLANVVHSCSVMLDDHKKDSACDSRYQIPPAILRWLTSYLSDRKYLRVSK
ncbi:MAG: hypothetical protein GY696_34945 [Gammaproteobacteria bacterium]|nr:hypothetical protein [Gammaproteobacteria bacterium]